MNHIRRIVPVYTSDVSGVCSALYEMGGMVVMHDPSGCNSTYNTHDEIRWYDKDSLIFISALTERDAAAGNDSRFYGDVLDTAKELKPRFVAITNSPIPYLTGTDFPAIAKKLEKELGIPCFYVPANGMHDYTAGAGKAFFKTAERLVEDTDKRTPRSINIIGMTPPDYAARGSARSIRKVLEDAGYKVNSVWAMDDDPDNIKKSGEAAVNLAVSSTGLSAARLLKKRFGTPCAAGMPAGEFSEVLIRAIKKAESTKEDVIAYKTAQSEAPSKPELTLIGEPVITGSLACAVRIKYGCETKVICPTEIYKGLLRETDAAARTEEEICSCLEGAKDVVADPFYKYILPEDARLHELPALALSGRIYLKKIPVLSEMII